MPVSPNPSGDLKKLSLASLLIGFLASVLALALKKSTEHFEMVLAAKASGFLLYCFLFPLTGLTVIYFLRKYVFRNKENKGIKEIFECLSSTSKKLPLYKIPSHFINGLLTVVFGGTTGIEVSTVVASAAIGSVTQQKAKFLNRYKTPLICAGVAAGITALFGSPIAGILFALEVVSRKVTKPFLITSLLAVTVASGLVYIMNEPALFAPNITIWHGYALPYFALLGILAGIHAVFLTKSVLTVKKQFQKMEKPFYRIVIGALLIGMAIYLFPALYGDGYAGVKEILQKADTPFTFPFFLSALALLLLKPLVTSVTLASGGDGGVFAPSLVMGAFLGWFTATFVNTFFGAAVIPVNFIIIGMAAVLSASIHAPFTALLLVCGISNDYTLFLPILMVCLISKGIAKQIYPFTVYSYTPHLSKP